MIGINSRPDLRPGGAVRGVKSSGWDARRREGLREFLEEQYLFGGLVGTLPAFLPT